MRIALLTDIYRPTINGVVHHVSLLKRKLEERGETVWLFVPGAKQVTHEEPNVVRIPGIPLADTGYHLSVVLDRRSRQLLSHMDVIHVHHPFVSGSFGLYAATRYEIPLIFTNHTRYDIYVRQYLKILPAAISDTALHAYFQSFSQRCAALIAPSEGAAQVMRSWKVRGKIVVIPNGVDVARFEHPASALSQADLGLPEKAVVAQYVGRVSAEKSLDRLLKVFRVVADEYAQVYLVVVGDGPELGALRELASDLGLDGRVRFTGAVPYDRIPDYMAAADFFVSASISEIHPLTFIEAAAAGLPALGVRSPGVTDIIVEGVTGLVAENNDLSFGLRFLRLAQDADLRRRMGRQAKEHSKQLSAEATASRIHALYHEVCRS